jgi:hypothetical protein
LNTPGGSDGGVLDHLGERIAAIGGVDQRQFLGVVAQHVGDAFEEPRALERRGVAPGREGGLGRGDGGIDIGRAAICDRTERFTGAGIDGVGIAVGFRSVPLAAVKGVAMFGQN